jgi:hypothetical protein
VLSFEDIATICRQTKVIDGLYFKQTELELIVNDLSKCVGKAAGLRRHECLELLVQVAQVKYVHSKT